MLDDFLLQHLGRRQIIQVVQAVVFQPEDVQAGLVAGHQLVVAEELEAICGDALVAVFRVIAGDEILQVIELQGARLQREMLVGAQVVKPHALGMHAPIFWGVVKEHHIRLHALRIENARGQAQHGVHIAVFQQLLANLLARPAFKQHVVWQHHRRFAVHLQHADDVLQKVELLVRRGRPKVLPLVNQCILVVFTFFVGERHTAFLAEGRVGQHIVHFAFGLGNQGVRALHQRLAVEFADAVQEQVHQAHAARVGHDLVAVEGLVTQKRLLPFVQRGAGARQPAVGPQEEASRAAGRVGNRLHRLGAHTGHHGFDQRARREILACAALGVFGIFLQQAFIQVALGVGIQADPAFGINQLHQARELGRVLNFVLRLEKDGAQHARLLPQPVQRGQVMCLQRLAHFAGQAGPAIAVGDVRVAVVGLLRVFVRQLQKQQVSELLQVVAIAHTVVAQGVAKVPDFLDEGGGVHASDFVVLAE